MNDAETPPTPTPTPPNPSATTLTPPVETQAEPSADLPAPPADAPVAPAGATPPAPPLRAAAPAPSLRFGDAWDYAPAPETYRPVIAARYGCFINGEFDPPPPGGAGEALVTINPADESVLSRVARAGDAEVDRAVRAARDAFPAWSGLPAKERAKHLYRIARRIQERARELAVLETLDGGKPIKESRDVDLPLVAQQFFYDAGWADKLRYAFPGFDPEPVGVCAQIIPWNFPLLMAAWKLAPALACGNTVVLKPAETTPLTALRLADILRETGLPPGVVNIVTGDGRTGEALARHPGIDKLAFTGSTAVGKQLAVIAAERDRPLPLTLELGGKSPNIIFDDAPIEQAVEGIVQAIYFNQGHVCCAGSRLLVQEGVRDEVIAKLAVRLASLRIGDPLDKNTDVGAVNSREQLLKIVELIESGREEGAVLHAPGVGSWVTSLDAAGADGAPEKGFWCRPCFFTNVHQAQRIAREEIFGPVLTVQTFRTPDEAVELANNTPYGLSAGVWTDKGAKAMAVASRIKAGVVWLNTFNRFDAASPFGGFKESGFGREGGMHGLRPYVRLT